MEPYKERIEDAMVRAEWEAIIEPAEAWIHSLGGERDPRPHFALNTVQLVRGEFGAAWKTHAHCLQEEHDIGVVRAWTDDMLHRHRDTASMFLVAGLCLAQSGESEQSVAQYKDAIRMDPAMAQAHYFLAQIHER